MAAGLAGDEKARQDAPMATPEPKEIVEQMELLDKNLNLLDERIDLLAVSLFDVSNNRESQPLGSSTPQPQLEAPLAQKLLEHNINLADMIRRIELVATRLEI